MTPAPLVRYPTEVPHCADNNGDYADDCGVLSSPNREGTRPGDVRAFGTPSEPGLAGPREGAPEDDATLPG